MSRKKAEPTTDLNASFALTLPRPESDLARESLKDPYRFDFLGLTDQAQERAVEGALVRHVTEFLLELGAGFAYVGRQVLLDVAGDEFFIDLLFYHLKLRCYVVIELKGGKFKPEHLGQLSFYLTAADEQVKHPQDGPTIGLLLRTSKNKVVAEYALGDSSFGSQIGHALVHLCAVHRQRLAPLRRSVGSGVRTSAVVRSP